MARNHTYFSGGIFSGENVFIGFTTRISMGFLHTARLSLIIAVAEIGRELNLVDENLFSSFMIVAIVSAIIGPVAGKYMLKKEPVKITNK